VSEQRAFANQEREFQVRRLGKLGRGLLMLLASVLSFVALGLLVTDHLYRPDTFKIEQLKIVGQFRYIEPSVIEAAVIAQASGNFFSLDLAEIKHNAEKVAWVESVDVRREWPGTLVLSVREHLPAMRWGKDKWISTAGIVIDLPEWIDASGVILLQGSESQAKRILLQATRWKKELIEQGLEVRGVSLSDSDAWTIKLYYQGYDAEFDLLLGHEEVAKRLERFELLFNRQFKFSGRPLKRVDARYPDGLAVEQTSAVSSDILALPNDSAMALNNLH
jgi:cell division protein FtsQ